MEYVRFLGVIAVVFEYFNILLYSYVKLLIYLFYLLIFW